MNKLDKDKLIVWEERTGLADFKSNIENLDLDKYQKERLEDTINKWIIDEFSEVGTE